MKHLFILLLPLLFSTQALAQKQAFLRVDNRIFGEAFAADQTFTSTDGQKVSFSRAELYLSNFRFTASAGEQISLKESVVLIDAEGAEQDYPLGLVNLPDIRQVEFNTGVNATLNHANPAQYPQGHPLALKTPSMHWGWAGGYIFMALEGKFDDDGDGVPEKAWQYHGIGDDLFHAFSIQTDGFDEDGKSIAVLSVDYGRMIDELKISLNPVQHGAGEYIQQIFQNMKDKVAFEGLVLSDVDDNDVRYQDKVGPTLLGESVRSIYVDLPALKSWTARLVNLQGQQLANYSSKTHISELDIPTLSAKGMYYLQVFEQGKLYKVFPLLRQ